MGKASESPVKQVTINVDVGATLKMDLEIMRRMIQDSFKCIRSVSVGDVVRLAVRRLYQEMLRADPEQQPSSQDNLDLWFRLSQEIQEEGVCPDWLMPGRGEGKREQSKPQKKGKAKCSAKKQPQNSSDAKSDSTEQTSVSS